MPDPSAVLPCCWYENPDNPGERFLVPGCQERVQDPDAECTCETPARELARLRREILAVRHQLTETTRELRDLHSAVLGHPDATGIYKKADQLRALRTPTRRTPGQPD